MAIGTKFNQTSLDLPCCKHKASNDDNDTEAQSSKERDEYMHTKSACVCTFSVYSHAHGEYCGVFDLQWFAPE